MRFQMACEQNLVDEGGSLQYLVILFNLFQGKLEFINSV